MKKLIALTALSLCLMAAPTLADGHGDKKGHGKRVEKMFDKKDTDSNGVISKAEYLAAAEKHFAKADADGNGEISKDEARAHHAKKKGKMKKLKKKMQERKGENAPSSEE